MMSSQRARFEFYLQEKRALIRCSFLISHLIVPNYQQSREGERSVQLLQLCAAKHLLESRDELCHQLHFPRIMKSWFQRERNVLRLAHSPS